MRFPLETPHHVFGQSQLRQRGGILICPDGVTEFTRSIVEHPTHRIWGGEGGGEAIPHTKAFGKWKITLTFECFTTPPEFQYDGREITEGLNPWPPKEILIGFFRWNRVSTGIYSRAVGAPDNFISAQWIDDAFVSSALIARPEAISGVACPWQIPPFAVGNFHDDNLRLGGLPGYVYFERWNFVYLTYTRSRAGSMPLAGNRYEPHYGPEFTDRCTARIPWESLEPGFVWEKQFVIPQVPYCDPAFTVSCWVPGGGVGGVLGWVCPTPSSSNPSGVAWRLSMHAKRHQILVACFRAERMGVRTYRFSDISSGDLAFRTWNFGDGATAGNVTNPTHTYAQPGKYLVSIVVTDAIGEVEVYSVLLDVRAIEFSWTPNPADVGDQITFTDRSLGATFVAWLWSFGEGHTSAVGSVVNHTFTTAGLKTVRMQVTDSNNTAGEAEHSFFLNEYLCRFTATPTVIDFPRVVRFRLVPTAQSAHAITNWKWTVSPGGTLTTSGNVATVTYFDPIPAVRTATLEVTNAIGRKATYTAVLIV